MAKTEEELEKERKNLAISLAPLIGESNVPSRSSSTSSISEAFHVHETHSSSPIDDFKNFATKHIEENSNDNRWNLEDCQKAYKEFVKEKEGKNGYVKAELALTESGTIDFLEHEGKVFLKYYNPNEPEGERDPIAYYEVESKEDLTIKNVMTDSNELNLQIIGAPYGHPEKKDETLISHYDKGINRITSIDPKGEFVTRDFENKHRDHLEAERSASTSTSIGR